MAILGAPNVGNQRSHNALADVTRRSPRGGGHDTGRDRGADGAVGCRSALDTATARRRRTRWNGSAWSAPARGPRLRSSGPSRGPVPGTGRRGAGRRSGGDGEGDKTEADGLSVSGLTGQGLDRLIAEIVPGSTTGPGRRRRLPGASKHGHGQGRGARWRMCCGLDRMKEAPDLLAHRLREAILALDELGGELMWSRCWVKCFPVSASGKMRDVSRET